MASSDEPRETMSGAETFPGEAGWIDDHMDALCESHTEALAVLACSDRVPMGFNDFCLAAARSAACAANRCQASYADRWGDREVAERVAADIAMATPWLWPGGIGPLVEAVLGCGEGSRAPGARFARMPPGPPGGLPGRPLVFRLGRWNEVPTGLGGMKFHLAPMEPARARRARTSTREGVGRRVSWDVPEAYSGFWTGIR